jgi:hypothetical protein
MVALLIVFRNRIPRHAPKEWATGYLAYERSSGIWAGWASCHASQTAFSIRSISWSEISEKVVRLPAEPMAAASCRYRKQQDEKSLSSYVHHEDIDILGSPPVRDCRNTAFVLSVALPA